jgi:hypothetical protein
MTAEQHAAQRMVLAKWGIPSQDRDTLLSELAAVVQDDSKVAVDADALCLVLQAALNANAALRDLVKPIETLMKAVKP